MQKPSQKQNYSSLSKAAVELVVPPDCAGLRLDQALARLLPAHSRNRLAQWIRDERVIVDGRAALPRAKVWGGEALRVTPGADPEALAHAPQDIPLEIVYEDESLLVVD